jgi:peptidoglycan/LPS O-acetylase OafA/YrhL
MTGASIAGAIAAPALAEVTDGRDNNVLALRFLAAGAVILFHSYALTDRWTDEPLWAAFAPLNLGALGVHVFFVLSGFLVTQSWLTRPTLRSFAAARALRIYPALVAATVFTILLAGATSTLPWREYLASPVTAHYLLGNASGASFVTHLPGVFPNNPMPDANGSLWTLPVELRLYVAVAIAGAVGLFLRPRAWLAAALVLVAAALAWPDAVPLAPSVPVTRQLAFLFLLGSLACVWQRHLRLSLPVAALAVAIVLADVTGGAREGIAHAFLLAYVVLVVGWHPALRVSRVARLPDLSYGLYVYAFPIQQAIVHLDPGVAPARLFALTLACTLAVSAVSWYVIEAPMLKLKSRFAPPRPSRP